MSKRALGMYVLLFLTSVMVQAGQLTTISSSSKADQAELHFAISGPFTYKLLVLNNPYRIVLDLHSTNLAMDLNHIHFATPLVQKVRSGRPDGKTLRLVVDVSQALRVRSSFWQDNGTVKGVKMVLMPIGKASSLPQPVAPKLNPQPKAALPKKVASPKKAGWPLVQNSVAQHNAPPPKPQTNTLSIKNYLMPQKNSSTRDVIVVVDAGHGGKDPGARGPHKSREKEVVLSIALKLKRLIDQQPGMHAVLTRSGDYYVGLRERLKIARKYNGDIFVSIHADAFNNPHSHGASVFALSQSGATSEAARWIAEKENYSELGGVNLGDLDDQNGVVRSVLIDLSQTSTINLSVEMGSRVLSQLSTFTILHNSKVEQARFMVLKSPDIPSILVETGFISNPKEEKNLTSYAYQMRLSQAIFNGVKGYFRDNPPHGTRIEAMTATK